MRHRLLRLLESVGLAQPAALQKALRPRRLDAGQARARKQRQSRLGPAVDELCAELDRHRQPRQAPRPAAAADAVARLDYQYRAPGARERIRRREARGTRADYDYVVACRSYSAFTPVAATVFFHRSTSLRI